MLNNFKTLFWDIDTKRFKPKKFPKYTIERLLEFGDLTSLKWLEKTFGKHKIYNTAKKSNAHSKKSKIFAKVRYGH